MTDKETYNLLQYPINRTLIGRLSEIREVEDLRSYMNSLFTLYENELCRVPDSDLSAEELEPVKKSVGVSCELIRNALETYLGGNPGKAIEPIETLMSKKSDIPMQIQSFGKKESSDQKSYWFKMRLREPGEALFLAEQMLHVPFDLRYKIQSYRYSVLGYPCLYAASSILCAWCEMGEPALERFAVTALQPTRTVRLLNLTLPTANDIRPLSEMLRMWPLIMACSIRVKDRDEPFKPEYIIPQLVMTSIRNLGKVNTTDGLTDIDGCLYTSTKRNGAFTVGEDKWWNILYRPKAIQRKGSVMH